MSYKLIFDLDGTKLMLRIDNQYIHYFEKGEILECFEVTNIKYPIKPIIKR